jgi:hypothetical protein
MNKPPTPLQQRSHKIKPPCTCASCKESTRKADQARQEILEILSRLDTFDELRFVLAEDPR